MATLSVALARRVLRRRICALQSCSGFVADALRPFVKTDRKQVLDVVIPDYRPNPGTEEELDGAALEGLPQLPYILYVGALRRIKGLEPLLAAYAQLTAAPPLVLIGMPAPETPKSFPSGVIVLPPTTTATVMAAWDRALFGVAPSILPEPLGNVVHEAMSRGRPVIGTRPGGHGEMIRHGVSGLLVPSGDVPALRDAMQHLLDEPRVRQAMGDAARVDAARFTRERVLPRFLALFEQVASSGVRRSVHCPGRRVP